MKPCDSSCFEACVSEINLNIVSDQHEKTDYKKQKNPEFSGQKLPEQRNTTQVNDLKINNSLISKMIIS